MLCILCVRTSEATIHIFRDEGCALNISEIIVKHFWLQPNPNDVNSNVICASCWKALDSFHKFYLKVEEAHLILQNINSIDEDDLKLGNEIAQGLQAPSVEPFALVAVELLKEDIKVELKEDADAILLHDVLPSESDKNSKSQNNSIDFESVLENDTPPACSTRSRKSGEKAYAESDSSSESKVDIENFGSQNPSPSAWRDQGTDTDDDDDDDDDSDYEERISKSKVKKKDPAKETTKRTRQKKGESKNTPCKKKRTTEEQSKKMERIKEYDEMIAKNIKLTCDICSEVFTNFAIMKRHYRSAHNACGYAACCGKKFRKRGVLVDHIYTHQNPEYFKCEKCGRVLANRKGLDCHMLTHDTEKQRIYQCDQCTMSFYTKPLLTRHLQTHISERNIKCPDCEKFFSTQDILRTHINNVHNAAYTRICDQCGKSFRRPDAFRKHQLEHDGITQPLVPCEKCSVKLTSKYGLKRHMESMHPETEMKHVCSECGKIAPSAAALQRHISYMHKMERKYKCPMCDKAFKKTGGLKEHMSTHTGEVLYTCPHCPKTFNSNANMHSHRKKMHRKEWEENRRHPHIAAASNPE